MPNRHLFVTGPSVFLVAQTQMVETGVKDFFEHIGVIDYPVLHEDTPVGRILSHLEARRLGEETDHSDGEMVVEFAGRQCYGSWKTGRDTPEYLGNIVETGHGSVLAQADYTFQISGISRALTHELVRHAMGVAISQESQRFVDGGNLSFVVPPALLRVWGGDITCEAATRWIEARKAELADYKDVQAQVKAAFTQEMLDQTGMADVSQLSVKNRTLIKKRANEAARASLPNAAETRGVWKFNYRALRYIIGLRGAEDADLEIRRLAVALALQAKTQAPSAFADVELTEGDFGVFKVNVQHPKP